MDKITDILQDLCTKYGISISMIDISVFTGNGNGFAGPSVVRENGIFRGRDWSRAKLSINSNLLSNPDKLKRTVTHEFGHIIQVLSLGERSRELVKEKSVVRFTSYSDNEAEIQAEAFTIYECGMSNYSKVGAKDMSCYNDALKRILNLLQK